MIFKQILTLTCILLIAVSIRADVPYLINYQGSLNDSLGNPVPDGPYTVTFTIYNDETTLTPQWDSGPQIVTTVNGQFTYMLGSNSTLFPILLEMPFHFIPFYLGLKVGADPEMTPRTLLSSVPYAYYANSSEIAEVAYSLGGLEPSHFLDWNNMTNIPADIADGDDVGAGGDFVNTVGDTMTGNLLFDVGNDGDIQGGIIFDGPAIDLDLREGIETKTYLYGSLFGEADFYDVDGSLVASIDAGFNGGRLQLSDTTGSIKIELAGNLPGNSSVILPNDAIDNTEILDEPGISQGSKIPFTTLPNASSTMLDIITTSITIPSAGYIVLFAKCFVQNSGTTSANYVNIQLDEEAGGGLEPPHNNYVGNNGYYSSSVTHNFSTSVIRTYFKPAGTYTFRLEGMKGLNNGSSSVSTPIITAMYFPTSYGSVATIDPLPPSNTEAERVTSTNLDGSTSTGYKYDLRDLELKAKDAALMLKEAELELMKAQQQQNRQNLKSKE